MIVRGGAGKILSLKTHVDRGPIKTTYGASNGVYVNAGIGLSFTKQRDDSVVIIEVMCATRLYSISGSYNAPMAGLRIVDVRNSSVVDSFDRLHKAVRVTSSNANENHLIASQHIMVRDTSTAGQKSYGLYVRAENLHPTNGLAAICDGTTDMPRVLKAYEVLEG